MSVFVWGLCGDQEHAQRAVDGLIEGSFPPDEIRVLTRGRSRAVERAPIRHKTAAPRGAAIGAVFGAGAAVLAASGAFGGPAATTEPLLGMLEVAHAGALTGAALGAYGGLYFWTNRVELPRAAAGTNGVLVGVTVPSGRAPNAADILRQELATNVHTSDIGRSGRPLSDSAGEGTELLSYRVREPAPKPDPVSRDHPLAGRSPGG
jgi:hypothetical protein